MHRVQRTIKVRDLDEPVNLHGTGDWHVGSAGCSERRLRAAIEAIAASPRDLVILMGDLADAIGPWDKRWSPRDVSRRMAIADLADWIERISDRVAEIAAPIDKRRVVGFHIGNHEISISRQCATDMGRVLCDKMGVMPMGFSCLWDLVFEYSGQRTHQRRLRVHSVHGSGAGRKEPAKLNKLIETMAITHTAQLVLMGHTHICLDIATAELEHAPGRIGEFNRLGVVCGTYMRTYVEDHCGYGEAQTLKPTKLGHAVISVVPADLSMSVRWA